MEENIEYFCSDCECAKSTEKVFICTFTRNIVKASDKICLAFILKNDIEKDNL